MTREQIIKVFAVGIGVLIIAGFAGLATQRLRLPWWPTPEDTEDKARMEQCVAQVAEQRKEDRFADFRKEMTEAREECIANWDIRKPSGQFPWNVAYRE